MLDAGVKEEAIRVRFALERSGLDHGPISVHDKMKMLGLPTVPAVASLARIFRDAGVARAEPKKKPRAAFRRFVYPAPNACWQLDATEYVLTQGRKCVIFQLIDDHSRLAVASHVALSENVDDAIIVFDRAVAKHGVPQRLLSDNGAALNPTRRGVVGKLVTHVNDLGVEAITGKPYKPTTQGKNERFHQTLFRWLHKQPLAETIEDLQRQVDEFDVIYNTQRGHQALPGRVTPQQAWDATPIADAPRPKPVHEPAPQNKPTRERQRDRIRETRVRYTGTVSSRDVHFQLGMHRAGEQVFIVPEADYLIVTDAKGTVILQKPWPAPGTHYVGNGRPTGPRPKPEPSPMS